MLALINVACKVALLGLLVFGALRPDLPQFAGKAMDARLFTFGLSAVILPVVWEIAEFYTFIKDGPEEATAYRDTLGDLFLSLCGSVTGALIVSAISASRSRSAT